jgi:hypothetical protein
VQTPPEQRPLQHCAFEVQLAPSLKHPMVHWPLMQVSGEQQSALTVHEPPDPRQPLQMPPTQDPEQHIDVPASGWVQGAPLAIQTVPASLAGGSWHMPM